MASIYLLYEATDESNGFCSKSPGKSVERKKLTHGHKFCLEYCKDPLQDIQAGHNGCKLANFALPT